MKKRRKKKPFPLTGYIIASLRKIWRWHPERKKALNRAKILTDYQCELCGLIHPRKGVQVDHIKPVVVPGEGIVSWDKYIKRLFVSASELRVLCIVCHKAKSANESRQRRKK